MRYYFINQEMKDIQFDVELSGNCLTFKFDGEEKKIYFKKLAGKYYGSFDLKNWTKLPRLGVNEILVSNSEIYKVFRGFKPSGLNAGGAGSLITQMPGKVVKVLKSEGDKVQKGETVLILEAMKMENEIKASTDGTLKMINVKEGQALESGFLMAEIE